MFYLYTFILQPQNQQQTPSKQHMQMLSHQGQFHPLHQSHHQQQINQSQHAVHFSHSQQCGPPPQLPEIAHAQQSSTISQHMASLQTLGHVGGRLHLLVRLFLVVLKLLFIYLLYICMYFHLHYAV